MPFDGNHFGITEIEILDRMKEFLSTPEKWCKRSLEKNGQYCILAAFNLAHHGNIYSYDFYTASYSNVFYVLNALTPSGSMVNYNNANDTTYADTINLIDKAREKFL